MFTNMQWLWSIIKGIFNKKIIDIPPPMPPPIPSLPITRIKIPQTNYMKGRAGWTPDLIVIHATEGLRGSVIQTFQTPNPPKSTHFMVCKTGEIVQFVGTLDTAFGNGIVVNPTDPTVLSRPHINPNFYSLSIEHELLKDEIPTPAQYQASSELLKLLSLKYNIPLDTKHVIPHHAIEAIKTCPNMVNISTLLAL